MVIRKRQLLMATLVVALGAAVFVNWYYTRPQAQSTGAEATAQANASQGTVQQTQEERENLGDAQYVNSSKQASTEYFASAKLRRQNAHDEAEEKLKKIINDKNADSEATKAANQALADIGKAIQAEADMENLVTAKIGSECVAILGTDIAEVVVGKGVLNEQITLQIQEIVMKHSSLPAEKITIIELKE